MYSSVPTTWPVRVARSVPSTRAMPKSVTLTRPVLADQHVGRLHVAVDDAAPVRVLERVEELAEDRDRLGPGQPAVRARSRACSVSPRTNSITMNQQLVVRASAVDARDAGVIELGQRDRLGAEALGGLRPPRQLRAAAS